MFRTRMKKVMNWKVKNMRRIQRISLIGFLKKQPLSQKFKIKIKLHKYSRRKSNHKIQIQNKNSTFRNKYSQMIMSREGLTILNFNQL